MARLLVIANPAAGRGTGAAAVPRIISVLERKGADFSLVQTKRPGHATELAEQAAQEFDVVAAAGGDGTANEVINGLLVSRTGADDGAILGVLGAGRGNDFANTIGIPGDLENAIDLLLQGQTRRIDIGRVFGGRYPSGRYFGNCVGIGFDAITTIEAAKLPRLGGFLSFLIAVLKTLILYNDAPESTVVYNGTTITQPSLMISIMNGRRLGGGFIMAPDAYPDDGLFDLCIARQVSRARVLALIPHFLRGSQATQQEITTGKAAKISISAQDGALPAQSDGEILCVDGQRLEIELLPQHLRVIGGPRQDS